MEPSLEIMLVCSAGMSTSMLVRSMKKVIEEQQLNIHVFAKPSTEAMEYIDSNVVDVVLLGPHVRFFEESYKTDLEDKNIAVATIPPRDYGTMDGEKVLQLGLSIIEG